MEEFWKYINSYAIISTAAQEAWQELLTEQKLAKQAYFLREGSTPKRVAFVKKGLLSYFYTDKDGATVIKKFFPEQTLVASTSAMLLQQASQFTIQALEPTEIISYPFEGFRLLTQQFPDISRFYIRYLEQHWVIEKEIGEISLKYETAGQRYLDFKHKQPQLLQRLKLHHVASYLGITPTQLSRIRAEL
ncbi:Crp/Fnr family transcriptional regulator [Pedobacter gandavensis]|uniref:Cyclic nucleotide-binding domain-containing protein n=1 Tax=Pedobacter gandavensis TaxID=2679963 RepID=A0ABR6EVP9_9SPHI|nr:Crp/Fnr family transcriptional regulator [Pedobacter gandavensis]MBB2149348.1 cyclic nucleotide-binding domain-containing protein [Pedobacter gandavensis]